MFHVDDVVRKLREKRGWTVEHLAHIMSADQGTIDEIEGGASDVRLGTLDRVAEAFQMDPGDLYASLPETGRVALGAHTPPFPSDHGLTRDPIPEPRAMDLREEEEILLALWGRVPAKAQRAVLVVRSTIADTVEPIGGTLDREPLAP